MGLTFSFEQMDKREITRKLCDVQMDANEEQRLVGTRMSCLA
jgi:hypothetical protein